MNLDAETPDGPHAFIQWKGTDACLDIRCECGAQYHFDGDFCYSVECGECGARWSLVPYVRLIPWDPETDTPEDRIIRLRDEEVEWVTVRFDPAKHGGGGLAMVLGAAHPYVKVTRRQAEADGLEIVPEGDVPPRPVSALGAYDIDSAFRQLWDSTR